MELLNKPLRLQSVNLMAPPKGGFCLASSRRLLVTWRPTYLVSDLESGEQYHLAFYHPAYGWRACRWDEEHGAPINVLPASESAIWVSTGSGKLIYISVGGGGEIGATRLASAESDITAPLRILHADADNLWIQEDGSAGISIMQLRLQKEGLTIVNEKQIHFYVRSMYPLAGGAWVLVENEQIRVFQAPSFEETVYEKRSAVSFYPPFIVRVGRKHCYHTEDPRRGWRKMPISIENASDEILFFAKHNDIYLAAVYRRQRERTLLYRFSDKSKMNAERMWEIPERLYPEQFAEYNGLVCIVDDEPLVISGREDVPENHGFLVWDPQSDTFYEDISQVSFMHAGHIISCNLHIPAAWSGQEHEQHIAIS